MRLRQVAHPTGQVGQVLSLMLRKVPGMQRVQVLVEVLQSAQAAKPVNIIQEGQLMQLHVVVPLREYPETHPEHVKASVQVVQVVGHILHVKLLAGST